MSEYEVLESVSDVLFAAANYLADHQLVQGEWLVGEDGNPVAVGEKVHACCARGAIFAVTGGDIPLAAAAEDAFSKYVNEPLDDFNDEPGRTKDEVVDAMRQAAESETRHIGDPFFTGIGSEMRYEDDEE